jgi:hypothetical protein
MANTEGTWLSILDYSHFKKVSISTIRRHIKANLVKWKEHEGKYLIWTQADVQAMALRKEGDVLTLRLELQRLQQENRHLKEELNEARMLIGLYEGGAVEPGEQRL